jgi:hypothetical protein
MLERTGVRAFFARLAVFRLPALVAAVFLVLEREAAARAAVFRRAAFDGVRDLAVLVDVDVLPGRFAAAFFTAFRAAVLAIHSPLLFMRGYALRATPSGRRSGERRPSSVEFCTPRQYSGHNMQRSGQTWIRLRG